MAGFVPGPQATEWGQQRTAIGGEWPPVLVDLDLRYWADPISCERRNRPSTRQLALTWGWKKSRVDRYLKRDTGGTVAGHSRDSGGTVDPDTKGPINDDRDTRGTPVGHSRDSGGTTPIVDPARPTPSPSPSPNNTALLRILSALKGKPIESASRMAPKQLKNFRAKTGATVDELVLVAEAMHRCPAPLFARDVRAEGWPEGSDRRKQLGTLLCQRRWDDRLSAAQEWRSKPARPVREVEPESVRAQRENLRRLRAERGGK